MERSNKHRSRRDHYKARKAPKVPIKTYRWEEIRRARRRGGYPWTHLYKGPFTEHIDPDQFTMEALRREKSSSPMGRRSVRVDISEVSSWADYSGKTTPTLLHELISEPQDDISRKSSRPGSVVIEEYLDDDDKDLEDDVQIKEFHTESAESSDNISQYLDKDEGGPATSKEAKRLLKSSKDDVNDREKRARSEETGERKRKLSAESGHSRYSLSKLGVLKKLQEAKNKIKVPKLSFSTKKVIRKRTSPPKEEKPKKATKKTSEPIGRLRKPDKPVYIHIPLKPPPGESDEFSHFEFEQKNGKESTSLEDKPDQTEEQPEETPAVRQPEGQAGPDGRTTSPISFTEEKIVDAADPKEEPKIDTKEIINIIEKKEDNENKTPFSTLERGPRVTKKPPLKINPAFKQFLKEVRQLKDTDLEAIQQTANKAEEKDSSIKPDSSSSTEKPLAETSSTNSPEITEINDDEELNLEEQQMSESESSPKEDVFEKLFEASVSKTEEVYKATSIPREVRSKSAEPPNKRRSSMDSSYSRKSLSKLAIVKKIKDASQKIKNAFSMDSLRKKVSKKNEKKDEEEQEKHKTPKAVKPDKILARPKHVEPVYIHIPLKPPGGETDEFSHLDSSRPEVVDLPEIKKEERTDSLDSSSPISAKTDGIQFIFLTPPSDDEILDEKEADIPETPSSASDDMVFFGSLKKLAQHAVDQVSPEKKNDGLETVREESVSDKGSVNGTESEESKETNKEPIPTADEAPPVQLAETSPPESEEKMVVDVEDGLNETLKTEEHLKSALKITEKTSPKRVSFKRKSKTPKDNDVVDDGGYEIIEPPKHETTLPPPTVLTLKLKLDNKEITDLEKKLEDSDAGAKEDLEGDKKLILLGEQSQSMSVDEAKSYLDKKMFKDTSLEEDYNQWVMNAKDDHEYEPINPPDEITVMRSVLPNVTVVDRDNDPKIVISATDILDKPVEDKKRAFFQFGRFHKDKVREGREKSQDPTEGSSDSHSQSSQRRDSPEADEQPKPSEGPSKFQVALKHRTDQIKTKTNALRNKMHNIKRPNIHLPKAPEFKRPQFKKPEFKKPDFKRFKIEKPKINFHLPKIPDTATFHLPHISLPGTRKTTETKTIERRQFSTESNADDSEQQTKRHKFDLSFGGTFPRFRKAKKSEQVVEFATMPRPKKDDGKKSTTLSSDSSTRIPLHSEDSMDAAERRHFEEEENDPRTGYEDRETSVDISRLPNRQFSGEVGIEDDYERENQAINRADYLSRWEHGNFQERKTAGENKDERIVGQLVEQRFGRAGQGYDHHHDELDDKIETLEERLRRDEDRPGYIEDEEEEEEFDMRLMQNKHMVTDLDNLDDDNARQAMDGYSSEGSGSLHRKGRLGKLDIDSDEFFVVHEIREGFQTPANALAQMNEYDPVGSNRSLQRQMRERQDQPIRAERKPIKKPKRKKTPHVSQEEIPGDEESLEEASTPSRPRRRSKRNKKKVEADAVVPYQETIPLDRSSVPHGQRLDFPRESLGILGDDERDDHEFEMYENERMRGREQPDILVIDPYRHIKPRFEPRDEIWSSSKREEPNAPPRKHRSLKSLTQSENESILTDARYEDDRNLDVAHLEDQIIQADQVQATPPRRPSRRSTSHTSSLSRMSLPPSQRDTDSVFTDEGYLAENQQIPSYLIENQSYKQLGQEIPSYLQEELPLQPCVEEPCMQDLRDCMGYAIIDKSKQRDPPLPPPRTPPRRRKREVDSQEKFATVPRSMGLNQSQAPPVRPVRNYSTLSHVTNNNSRTRSPSFENEKEDKENQAGPYIEIEDDVARALVSGEVVRKMRQRPLPAPPRPPRKSKTLRRSLQDITSKENILAPQPEEETVSTQTEPLPSDFECEEIRQEPTDTIITPRVSETRQTKRQDPALEMSDTTSTVAEQSPVQRFDIYDPRNTQNKTSDQSTLAKTQPTQVRREIITPSVYSFEETVTHGTLLVQPLGGAKVIPDHQLSKERLVPVTKDFSDEEDETSEVPESFKLLKHPEDTRAVLKAGKLQVTDLDVDRLTVNELLASKIVVSEIDTSTISTNEIQGKSGGAINLSNIQLPPELLEQLVRNLESQRPAASESSRVPMEGQDIPEEPLDRQKKTPIFKHPVEYPVERLRAVVDLESSHKQPESSVDPHLFVHSKTSSQQEVPSTALDQGLAPQASQESPLDQSELDEDLERESSVEFQQDLNLEPPVPPPRSSTLLEEAVDPPPRKFRRKSKHDSPKLPVEEPTPEAAPPSPLRNEMLEPDVDDEPPPRPPQPLEGVYLPSQPPASFYALRAKQFVDENIPTAPRRKRHQSARSRPVSRSRSTSDDSSLVSPRTSRPSRRSSEPSIPELSGRLIQVCGTRINNTLKRLIYNLTDNVLRNADGKQDLHVFMIILLVLIAGLILLGYGEDRTVIHLHHWEYFNPPKDI